MKSIIRLYRYIRADDGNVTVEFVLLFPALMYIFMIAFEVGLWNVREMMLRRATNVVVREVKLSTGSPPTYEELRKAICDGSLFTTDCETDIRIDMQAFTVDEWARAAAPPPCLNRAAPIEPVSGFTPGAPNMLMVMRVCRLFDPIFPGGSIGRAISENADAEYGVRVTAAFVSEPQ
jgi:hypothetical protein